jgi:hypothetical protein
MLDKVAVEPRLRYSAQQDAVSGVCREHAERADLCAMSIRDSPVDTLFKTKALLDAGKCHPAAEATMAAIAKFGKSDYHACVILGSSTCKTEKATKQAELIEQILKCWKQSPDGECKHGPIWSVCTDGDARRRLAIFKLCMNSCVTPSSELYRLIGGLPLLNLCCGPTEITHDGDYKHEEKSASS